MIVPDDVRKCVVFIGYKMADNSMRMAGSGFFVGKDEDGVVKNSFLVTAKHVIQGITELGLLEIYIRANNKQGESEWIPCQSNEWLFHPEDDSVDLALLKVTIPNTLDHLIFPLSLCVTESVLIDHAVGLGDEVFITGLFKHHSGVKRNIPIVRVGNLAALSEEKVFTKKYGPMEAYLIEARSIGGLSGSPVFLNLGLTRYIEKEIKHAQGGPIFFLLGLIHGHYDVINSSEDNEINLSEDALTSDKVNSGIAIVVPMYKINEAIQKYSC